MCAYLSITLLSVDDRKKDINDSKHNETLKGGNMTPCFRGGAGTQHKFSRAKANEKRVG